jgi:hypothetical protein
MHFFLEIMFELNNPFSSHDCLRLNFIHCLYFVLLHQVLLLLKLLILLPLLLSEHVLLLGDLSLSALLDLHELLITHFVFVLDLLQLLLQFNLVSNHVVKDFVIDLFFGMASVGGGLH